MDQGEPPTRLFHLRMLTVIAFIAFSDVAMLGFSIEYTFRKGPSMIIIFGFEVTCSIVIFSSILS